MSWFWFGAGIVVWQVARDLHLILTRKLERQRDKQFVKSIKVRFPDHESIQITTVSSSNRDAIANIERRLRDETD